MTRKTKPCTVTNMQKKNTKTNEEKKTVVKKDVEKEETLKEIRDLLVRLVVNTDELISMIKIRKPLTSADILGE